MKNIMDASDMGGPLISVVTVCYNAEQYIERTLNSVLAQKFNNFEYIVIDGASSDSTLDKAKSCLNHPDGCGFPVVLYSGVDEGVYDAMNKAVTKCSGEYIVFMNAGDEFYDANTLDSVARHVRSGSYDVIYGRHVILSDTSDQVKMVDTKPLTNLWRRMVFCHQTMYVKRSILLLNPFNIRNISADHSLIFRLYSKGYVFSKIDANLARYLDGGVSVKNYRTSIIHRFRGILGEDALYRPNPVLCYLYYAFIFIFEPVVYSLRSRS